MHVFYFKCMPFLPKQCESSRISQLRKKKQYSVFANIGNELWSRIDTCDAWANNARARSTSPSRTSIAAYRCANAKITKMLLVQVANIRNKILLVVFYQEQHCLAMQQSPIIHIQKKGHIKPKIFSFTLFFFHFFKDFTSSSNTESLGSTCDIQHIPLQSIEIKSINQSEETRFITCEVDR